MVNLQLGKRSSTEEKVMACEDILIGRNEIYDNGGSEVWGC